MRAQTPAIEGILGVCAKPFATLGDNMSVVIAAKLLHDSGIDPRRIRKVIVKFWRHYAECPGTSFRGPFERIVQALASTTFSAAAMLVYGELEYATSRRITGKTRTSCVWCRWWRSFPMTMAVPTMLDVTVELDDDGTSATRSASEAPRAQRVPRPPDGNRT